jgi:carboxylesterase type B
LRFLNFGSLVLGTAVSHWAELRKQNGATLESLKAITTWKTDFSNADGGFLQWGSPNGIDLRALLSESPTRCIIVAPAYRLNVFGFLGSKELLDSCPDYDVNLGFWDQRLALQWTFENVSYFGGDASNITVGGYSAGSHSVFHQLSYDLGLPDEKAVIKRVMMLSNGPGMQPKSLDEVQEQFDELLQVLDITATSSPAEKLDKLRSMTSRTIIEASNKIKHHQFRAVTDGSFVRHGLLEELSNGVYAQRMNRRNVEIIIGECSDEHFVYGLWRPPRPGYDNMLHRLEADVRVPDVRNECETYADFVHQHLVPTRGM